MEWKMTLAPHLASPPHAAPLPAAADDSSHLHTAPIPAAYPAHLVEAMRLPDGTALTIRPIRGDDYRLELDFIRGLSKRSAYQRLLSPRKLRASDVMRLVRIDYSRELALIATTIVEGQVRQIGVARYAP